jgi:PEP-CTERM motif
MGTKNTIYLPVCFSIVLGAAATASALTVNVSLDTAGWEKTNLVFGGTDYQGPATIANTAEGHLRGTKTTATGGSNYSLGLHTTTAYDFQDATLRTKWLLNGQGNYAGIYTGLDTGDGHAHLINNFDPNPPSVAHMTTAWSWLGSEVIPSNTWLWAEVKFSAAGYDFAISKTGYGSQDYLHGSKPYATTVWDKLAAAKPFFQIGDNYTAGAYFEVSEVTIITKDPPSAAVPEPATMLLFGAGLTGLAAVARRKRVS